MERGPWRGPTVLVGPQAQLPVSPSKFLSVEASAVLCSLQTMPEFAETMELIESVSNRNKLRKTRGISVHTTSCHKYLLMNFARQDPATWNSVAAFDLQNAAPSSRHSQAGYTSLQEKTVYNSLGFTVNAPADASGHDRSTTPFGLGGATSRIGTDSSKPTQASTGRKRRRERGEPLCGKTCSSFLENMSPKKTPTKSQPFTPSQVNELHPSPSPPCNCCIVVTLCCIFVCVFQFCNISGTDHLSLDDPTLTSTPVCGQRCLLNTPLHKVTTPKHQKENDG